MKNRKTRKLVLIALVLTLCLSLSVNVLAFTDTVKTLTAHFSGIQIMIDGEKITPHDANGKYVEPFIVDGTTYLPVRAVGEAFGKEVGWDGVNRVVSIGHAASEDAPWKELHPYTLDGCTRIYDGSDPKAKFTAAGYERRLGIVFNDNAGHMYNANIIWNTNGLYKTLNFTTCCISGKSNVTMKIYLGDELFETYAIKWNEVPLDITVPVNYAANVRITLETSGGWTDARYAMYDIDFEM